MTAADVAFALGAARRDGRGWRCRCPLHGGRSLILRNGDTGRLLAWCFGGCDSRDVLVELRRRGLLNGRGGGHRLPAAEPPRHDEAARIARALSIWHEALPGARTIVEKYLNGREIWVPAWPAAVRFHPRCPRPKDGDNFASPLPAMVALVEHVGRGPVGVHCTYLRPDGSGKADIEKPKAIFGVPAGGAVRFAMPRSGTPLAVCEGLETTLAVMTACGMPGWAALSAVGLRALVLPPEATDVVICADHDESGVGQRAAHDAAQRFLAEGRRTCIAMPPEPNTDMADVLLAGAANGARYVA